MLLYTLHIILSLENTSAVCAYLCVGFATFKANSILLKHFLDSDKRETVSRSVPYYA